jgi:hypothetical protein
MTYVKVSVASTSAGGVNRTEVPTISIVARGLDPTDASGMVSPSGPLSFWRTLIRMGVVRHPQGRKAYRGRQLTR